MSAPNIEAVEPGGTAASLVRAVTLAGRQRARVHPGRPVTVGPAVCQGCGSLVWWSGGLWCDGSATGTWHRCAR